MVSKTSRPEIRLSEKCLRDETETPECALDTKIRSQVLVTYKSSFTKSRIYCSKSGRVQYMHPVKWKQNQPRLLNLMSAISFGPLAGSNHHTNSIVGQCFFLPLWHKVIVSADTTAASVLTHICKSTRTSSETHTQQQPLSRPDTLLPWGSRYGSEMEKPRTIQHVFPCSCRNPPHPIPNILL